jgi:hypothetical protein
MELKLFENLSKRVLRCSGDSDLKYFLFHFITVEIRPVSTKAGSDLYRNGRWSSVLLEISTIVEIQCSRRSR